MFFPFQKKAIAFSRKRIAYFFTKGHAFFS